MPTQAVDGPRARLRSWFPDREFFMRSHGQVRFIKISSRLQMIAAAVVGAMVVTWLATLVVLAMSGLRGDRAAPVVQAAPVRTAESRAAAETRSMAADLQRRQDVIEKMVEGQLGDLPDDAPDTADVPAAKVSAATPAGLAALAARQDGFVSRLTRYADARIAASETRIRKLGINPRTLLASAEREARGGPFIQLARTLEPDLKRLGERLARLSALERGLQRVPQVMPASLASMSSGFGYRSDPFSSEAAFHAGLDFAGPMGAPIYAAAAGRVSFVGVKAGYGNAVEISHGNGLVTRYAHMSAFRARVGQTVEPGDQIGAIGSTGRSTGPHLHFEVRIDDRAVNPRPFLAAGAKAAAQR